MPGDVGVEDAVVVGGVVRHDQQVVGGAAGVYLEPVDTVLHCCQEGFEGVLQEPVDGSAAAAPVAEDNGRGAEDPLGAVREDVADVHNEPSPPGAAPSPGRSRGRGHAAGVTVLLTSVFARSRSSAKSTSTTKQSETSNA